MLLLNPRYISLHMLAYAHAHNLSVPNVKLSNKATSVIDKHCLPWQWTRSETLFDRLHFYSRHDLDLSAELISLPR